MSAKGLCLCPFCKSSLANCGRLPCWARVTLPAFSAIRRYLCSPAPFKGGLGQFETRANLGATVEGLALQYTHPNDDLVSLQGWLRFSTQEAGQITLELRSGLLTSCPDRVATMGTPRMSLARREWQHEADTVLATEMMQPTKRKLHVTAISGKFQVKSRRFGKGNAGSQVGMCG